MWKPSQKREKMNIELDTFNLLVPVEHCTFPNGGRLEAYALGDLILEGNDINAITGEEYPRHSFADSVSQEKRVPRRASYAFSRELEAGVPISFFVDSSAWLKGKKHIGFVIGAKILGSQYLEGITKKNIKKLYDIIMGLGEVHCSFEAFKDGLIVDADFKSDLIYKEQGKEGTPMYQSASEIIEAQLDAIEARTIPEITSSEHRFKRIKLKSGKGQAITFNSRLHNNRSTKKGFQHIMLYNKSLQLRQQASSIRFNAHHNVLEGIEGDILRVEINAHSKFLRQVMHYNDDLTLRNFLDFSNEFKLSFFTINSPFMFTDANKPIKVKSKNQLRFDDVILFDLIETALKEAGGFEASAVEKVVNLVTRKNELRGIEFTRSQKSRFRSKVSELVKNSSTIALTEPLQTNLDAQLVKLLPY